MNCSLKRENSIVVCVSDENDVDVALNHCTYQCFALPMSCGARSYFDIN